MTAKTHDGPEKQTKNGERRPYHFERGAPDGLPDGFDIDQPRLAKTIDAAAFTSGSYPYPQRMKRKAYDKALRELQIELLKLQYHARETGSRQVIVFEGRDAAGKGGTITRIMQHLNPRYSRVVALAKPNEAERGQWYFQRYTDHLPTAGHMTIFDRSWYNRGGVEPVMGFTPLTEVERFLEEVPRFEKMLVDDGIRITKLWLEVGREMQLKRLHARRHDPLKQWKLSDIDLIGLAKWDDYTEARNAMLRQTDSRYAPWTVIRSNDKRRLRLNACRVILGHIRYSERNEDHVGKVDRSIVHGVPEFFSTASDG
ncbi:MAG: polyphosphate kinase 2 [Pseudomonadota bacterium]